MKKILLCAAFATITAGCATTESNTDAAAKADRGDYTTGSNIPRRSKAPHLATP